MPKNYLEQDFEDHIEEHLLNSGYHKCLPENYDCSACLLTSGVLKFVQDTQPKEYKKLELQYGSEAPEKLIYRLNKEISLRGTLDILRKGISDRGANVKLAYFKPSSGMNPKHAELYMQNRFSVVRQLKYSASNEKSLDMVIFLNGLPIITMELKNSLTGQTVEEGFILDVLENYTTLKRYFKLKKKYEGDKEYEKKKAVHLLTSYVDLQPHAIEKKTTLMLDHFLEHTVDTIQRRGRAMVVTRSRLHTVRYFLEFKKQMEERGITYKPLVAFSGEVEDLDASVEYTETGLNQLPPKVSIPDACKTPDYRILIVAEKFQTGFDEPMLHTMYVDRKLEGVHAVQTLSRLNRTMS
ncbi:MAG: type I restriction endonuclease [Nitrospirae bacterium YQR-1]